MQPCDLKREFKAKNVPELEFGNENKRLLLLSARECAGRCHLFYKQLKHFAP